MRHVQGQSCMSLLMDMWYDVVLWICRGCVCVKEGFGFIEVRNMIVNYSSPLGTQTHSDCSQSCSLHNNAHSHTQLTHTHSHTPHTLTCSHSPTHPLTHSHTHSLTHSLIHSRVCPCSSSCNKYCDPRELKLMAEVEYCLIRNGRLSADESRN